MGITYFLLPVEEPGGLGHRPVGAQSFCLAQQVCACLDPMALETMYAGFFLVA